MNTYSSMACESKIPAMITAIPSTCRKESASIWGFLQERIVSKRYDGEIFKGTMFLVLCNRLISIAAWRSTNSMLRVRCPKKPSPRVQLIFSGLDDACLKLRIFPLVTFGTRYYQRIPKRLLSSPCCCCLCCFVVVIIVVMVVVVVVVVVTHTFCFCSLV